MKFTDKCILLAVTVLLAQGLTAQKKGEMEFKGKIGKTLDDLLT